MDENKIYTNLSYGFEIEIIGKCRKLNHKELSILHYEIRKKLENYILAFKLPTFPDFKLNEIGELSDYEIYTQAD